MDKSIDRFKKRRQSRMDKKHGVRVDSVDEYVKRRKKRVEKRLDAGVGWVFGALKGKGVDTEGMSVNDAFEKWNEINKGKGSSKKEEVGSGKKKRAGEKEVGKQSGKPPKGPKVKGMSRADVSKTIGECHSVGGKNYTRATDVAKERPVLRTFTTHGMDHVEQVLEKTNQAADVVEKLSGSRFKGIKMDRKLMLAAAYFHDTGMDGGDADWGEDDGSGIRGNHAMNSAIHILENSDAIEKIGVSPSQVAFVAFAHTKSKSGINDLTDPEAMKEGLDRVEKAVREYNDRNPGKEIKFDRDAVFGGEPDEDNIRQMACQIAALRLGDANREANIPLRSQTGGEYNVESLPKQEDCESRDREAELAKIVIKNETGTHDLDNDDDEELGVLPRWSRNISKYTVLGERNMVKVDAVPDKDGIAEAVVLNNGNDVPWSTTEALLERCGELNTINGIPRSIRVKMSGVDNAGKMTKNAQRAYETMWSRILTETKKGVPAYDGIDEMVLEFDDGSTAVMQRENSKNGKNRSNRRNA